MADFSNTFHRFEGNLKALVESKKALERELALVNEKNESLAEKLESYSSEIEDLKEKNKILRIAGGTNGGDNREIKLKINEIVREVDKCIAQLNQ